jgi:hypothetical protein
VLSKQSDVEAVYRRGDWHGWNDIVRWFERKLEHDDQADNELSEAETQELLGKFRQLDKSGREFTSDPAEAYRILQSV